MNYNEAIQYIHSKLVFGSKPGLSRVAVLLNKMDNPQESLKIIHIAGTNGKGSTATFINNMLVSAQYKVGLYISPYVYNFKERISVCNELISDEDFAKYVSIVEPYVESLDESPTEFEILTAVAFLYFKDIKCDYIVLEVGLGGRFDATNIIKKPLCSVITSISLDHTQYLGDTIGKIAFEKCGIVKDNIPTITYALQKEEALNEIIICCENKNSKLYIPNLKELEIIESSKNRNIIKYKDNEFTIPVGAKYQIYNFLTALETITFLKNSNEIKIEIDKIKNGISNFFIPARLEKISENPTIIIDGSHNEDGIKTLCESIKENYKDKEITTILGILKDKNFEKIIEQIAIISNKVITITPDSTRALAGDISASIAKEFCKDSIYEKDFLSACTKALNSCKNSNAIILVTGSFTIVKDIKNNFLQILE